MISRAFLFIAVCLTTITCVAAQSETAISGRVTDPHGAAISGAIVTLFARDNSVVQTVNTDSGGNYAFRHLVSGDYLVQAEAAGFVRASTSAVQIAGYAAIVDLTLKLAGAPEFVVVTAAGNPQPVDELSKSTTVVSSQEIEQRDEYSLTEALRTVPGLRVQQLGGPGSFVNVKSRGLRNQDTAVLIDGLRFRDPGAPQGDSSGFLEDLLLTDTDRIEVLRGSGSSLYGTNAIGGVLNIVTDPGGGRANGHVLFEGGSLGLYRGRAGFSGGTERIFYSGGASHLNVVHGVDGDDAARITNGQGRVTFRPSLNSSFSGRIYASNSFLQTNSIPEATGILPPSGIIDAVPLSGSELRRYETGTPLSRLNLGRANFIPAANDPDSRREANFFSGLLSFTQHLNETFSYSVDYQGLVTRRTHRNGPGGVSFQPANTTTRSDFDGSLHTLLAQGSLRAASTHLTAGYEFEYEGYLNRSFPGRSPENSTVEASQRSNTLFVQDQLRLLDNRLQFSAAFRAQFFSLHDPRFTPQASAPYKEITFTSPPRAYTGDGSVAYFFRSTGTKLRTHVGNGYRAPSIFERFGTFFGSFGYSAYGDPRLRPDRSIAFDAGVDQKLLRDRLSASATYFYTRLQEVVIFDFSGTINPATDPFGRFGGYRNSGGELARGLELSVSGAPLGALDLALGYTYTNADQRNPAAKGVVSSFVIPLHQFSAVATQRVTPRFFVNLDLIASSGYLAPFFDPKTFATRAFRFDGIVKTDLGASYTVPVSDSIRLRLHGKVDNIFDRHYYENGYRTPGAAGILGMKLEF
ncbi:MAG TPA: TonB-dependent receptor [Acidobacteriota bacterium]|jgi:iron complex outermembrane receptor protein